MAPSVSFCFGSTANAGVCLHLKMLSLGDNLSSSLAGWPGMNSQKALDKLIFYGELLMHNILGTLNSSVGF